MGKFYLVIMVSFKTAIENGFKKAFNFSGRATRAEYWWWQLFVMLVNIAFMFVFGLLFSNSECNGMPLMIIPLSIWYILIIIPNLSLFVRRLHDTGRSAWNLLWPLLPYVGAIILLVFTLQKSAPDNEYGTNYENQ